MRRKDVKQEDSLVGSELSSTGQVAAGVGSPDTQVRLGMWLRAFAIWLFPNTKVLIVVEFQS